MSTGYTRSFNGYFNALSAGHGLEESVSATQTRSFAEILGFKTTAADMPKVDTGGMLRHGQSALKDAGDVRQNIAAGRTALQTFQASFKDQHETAMREINAAGNEVAAEMGLNPYIAMASIAPKPQTTAACVATNAIGGATISAAGMAADLIGERKALTPGQAQQFVAKLHAALAEKAHAAQEQVKLGIVPEGQQKPMMKWNEMKPKEFAEFLKTPVQELPEMKASTASLDALGKVEGQLDMAEANAKYNVTADKVAAALQRGDTEYIQKAFEIDPKLVRDEIEKALDLDCGKVLVEIELMSENLTYNGLDTLLGGHACYLDAYTCNKILKSRPETQMAAAAPVNPNNNNNPTLTAPNPFANTTPMDTDSQTA